MLWASSDPFHSESIKGARQGDGLLAPEVNPRKVLEGRQIVAIMRVKRNVDLGDW